MPSPPPTGRELLDVLDACLAGTASALHDRPVQQLVAAKLMIETALPAEQRHELVGRAVDALGAAGQQTRQLMWLLTPPVLRPDALAHDVREALAPGGALDLSPRISAALDEDVDADDVACLVRALHHLLGEAVLAAIGPAEVTLTSDAESVEGTVVLPEPVDGPWARLAALRIAVAGGTSVVDDDAGGGRRVTLRLPRAR